MEIVPQGWNSQEAACCSDCATLGKAVRIARSSLTSDANLTRPERRGCPVGVVIQQHLSEPCLGTGQQQIDQQIGGNNDQGRPTRLKASISAGSKMWGPRLSGGSDLCQSQFNGRGRIQTASSQMIARMFEAATMPLGGGAEPGMERIRQVLEGGGLGHDNKASSRVATSMDRFRLHANPGGKPPDGLRQPLQSAPRAMARVGAARGSGGAPCGVQQAGLVPERRKARLSALQQLFTCLLNEADVVKSGPVKVVSSLRQPAIEPLDCGEADLLDKEALVAAGGPESVPEVVLSEYGETLCTCHGGWQLKDEGAGACCT